MFAAVCKLCKWAFWTCLLSNWQKCFLLALVMLGGLFVCIQMMLLYLETIFTWQYYADIQYNFHPRWHQLWKLTLGQSSAHSNGWHFPSNNPRLETDHHTKFLGLGHSTNLNSTAKRNHSMHTTEIKKHLGRLCSHIIKNIIIMASSFSVFTLNFNQHSIPQLEISSLRYQKHKADITYYYCRGWLLWWKIAWWKARTWASCLTGIYGR